MADTNPILPFKNFRFVVYFPDVLGTIPVAAVSKVSSLKRTTEVVTHRDGGDLSTPRHAPGSTKFEPITLERGITLHTEFEDWANLVYSTDKGTVTLANYKRDITIEVRNVAGDPVVKYQVTRAWVSEYVALPDLDANANAVMLEHVVIQNEGWFRLELPTPGSQDQ